MLSHLPSNRQHGLWLGMGNDSAFIRSCMNVNLFRKCDVNPFSGLVLACCLCGLNVAVQAQSEPTSEVASNGAETFDRAYFDAFSPQTALDMVGKLPGFTMQGGDGQRGFGGGAGNVLIDGQRPSSKSVSLAEVLMRIPADNVARIELNRGAVGGNESSGQSVVANVITQVQGMKGTWSTALVYNTQNKKPSMTVDVAVSVPLGAWVGNTRFHVLDERHARDSWRDHFDAQGALLRHEYEWRPSTHRDVRLATEWKRDVGDGSLVLVGNLGTHKMDRDSVRLGYLAGHASGEADQATVFDWGNEHINYEGSISYSTPLGEHWTAKALLLGTYRDYDSHSDRFTRLPSGALGAGSKSVTHQEPLELIARTTFAYTPEADWRTEFGGEVAFNQLDNAFSLTRFDAQGNGQVVDLPAANIVAEEWRSDVFGQVVWQFAPKWTLETGMAFEASTIEVTGNAANRSQDFFFSKPHVALVHDWNDAIQIRGSLRHQVGQLNFQEFAASSNLEDDQVFAGNPTIKPSQTTRAELTFDWHPSSLWALNVGVFRERRLDVLEQVLLPSGRFALGNAGDAKVWGMNSKLTMPLSPLLENARLSAGASWVNARFDDPLTGVARTLNGLNTPIYSIDLRHDVTGSDWSWGGGWYRDGDNRQYFINQTFQTRQETGVYAFIETTRWAGLKTTLSANPIGGRNNWRHRTLYAPDRRGDISGTERQRVFADTRIELKVEGSF